MGQSLSLSGSMWTGLQLGVESKRAAFLAFREDLAPLEAQGR